MLRNVFLHVGLEYLLAILANVTFGSDTDDLDPADRQKWTGWSRAFISSPALGKSGCVGSSATGSLQSERDSTNRSCNLRPQIIVNAAAYTAVDKAEAEQDIAYTVNADAPSDSRRRGKQNRRCLVHYSTDYVFDGSKHAPYDETIPQIPSTSMASPNLQVEIAIRQAGVAHLIFRISWVYATRGQNFLLTLLRLGSQREELRMVRDQIGTPELVRRHRAHHMARRSSDLCTDSGLLSFSRKSRARITVRVPEPTTRFDFAQAICDELCLAPSVSSLGRNSDRRSSVHPAAHPSHHECGIPYAGDVRPLYSVLSNKRLFRTFGIPSSEWRSQLHEIFAAQES